MPPTYAAARAAPSAAGVRSGGDGRDALGRLGAGPGGFEPVGAVGAHRLDDRDQREALVRERVLDARRDFGVGLAGDDALLLERAQAQRERARADAGQRALELAEPRAALRQVTDDQQGPLSADHFGGAADGTIAVRH